MSVESNNATPPTFGIAPGRETLEPRAFAKALGLRSQGPIDPRIPALMPGFDAPFFQAGLAGYSDAAMRIIARRHGCPMCVTEALLDRTLLAGGRGFAKADLGELHDNIPGGPEDHPLTGQIMGSDPREMAAGALKMVEQRARSEKTYRTLAYAVDGVLPSTHLSSRLHLPGGEQLAAFDVTEGLGDAGSCGDADFGSCDPLDQEPDGAVEPSAIPERTGATGRAQASFQAIDVNLACPVKKIEKKARGGHWLTEPTGAIAILEAVREALPAEVVCTLKIRRSFDDTPEMAENFDHIIDAAFRIGYAWATVHGRTVVQKYIGPSRWDILRTIVAKQRAIDDSRLVFGSGDVWSADEIFRMLEYTGVAAVSVARGCIGNPWIFRQARQMLRGEAPAAPSLAEQRAVLEDHYRLLLAVCRPMRDGEDAASKMIRKFGIRFAQHHPDSDRVRLEIIRVDSAAAWAAVLERWYAEPQG